MPALSEIGTMHVSSQPDATRKQIRGSSLFLVGRFLSMGINFSGQVLMVRYLATAEYGALAYALAAVAFFQPFATLGLHDAVSRFVPIYQENREHRAERRRAVLRSIVPLDEFVSRAALGCLYVVPGIFCG
jgi:O-antigen/teichoic acid export membrane protein